jgi:drebrin-like protein
MASLNLSTNGPSIKSSYQAIVGGPSIQSGSPTYAQWALFTVQAPLVSAFQTTGAKESVLKVETTGGKLQPKRAARRPVLTIAFAEGELSELNEDFNDGRIQFAFVKVKDANTSLPKYVLIAWCGGGVPERTKGYFTNHLNAVSKILHGYHVQITARSENDIAPETIIQKVADASGAKYSAGSGAPAPPVKPSAPVASKPVFTPTTSSAAGRITPLVAARGARRDEHVDEDGWGADAPPVTRTQLEKVQSAYKPTKVNLADLTRQQDEPSRFSQLTGQPGARDDVVKGGYQPIGKVDIAAIRAAAKTKEDLRPAPVKSAYEPVGTVDIAAIRAKAQKPAAPTADESSEPAPKSLAERTAAFAQPERLTALPKPKVANKFGGSSSFTGTKAPTPGGLGFGAPAAAAQPVVGASRTFADQGGKTPAQIWAEKKGKQAVLTSTAVTPPMTSPIGVQKSGEWKSGYSGKSWAPVQTSSLNRGISGQVTGESERSMGNEQSHEEPVSPSGAVSALRDRFKGSQPMGGSVPSAPAIPTMQESSPPPLPSSNRPGPAGGFAIPGLPSRPHVAEQEEEEAEEAYPEREESPPRVAIPVARGREPPAEPPVPARTQAPTPPPEAEEEPQAYSGSGKRAIVLYDYEKAEDNEIDLHEDEVVTDIDFVDEDWWMGFNSKNEMGLFPSNYVKLVEDDAPPAAPMSSADSSKLPVQAAPQLNEEEAHELVEGANRTATAQFDYEAAEDNGRLIVATDSVGPELTLSRTFLCGRPDDHQYRVPG